MTEAETPPSHDGKLTWLDTRVPVAMKNGPSKRCDNYLICSVWHLGVANTNSTYCWGACLTGQPKVAADLFLLSLALHGSVMCC